MKHYIVALDEHGNSIHNMDFATTSGEKKESTDDWNEAIATCGMMNHYLKPGELVGDRQVAGYEVVSEEA